MSRQLAKRWFTVSEYNRMAETGILTEHDRVELLEGEIVEMSPIGSRHAASVNRLTTVLSRQVGADAIVSVQNPIIVDDYSEPEPDVAVLRAREDFYETRHPEPADVLLVIEVADTSIETDCGVKVPLYARAGVPETVLVNLPGEAVEVYADPVNGQYQSVAILRRGNVVGSRTIPHLKVSVDAILG